MLFILHAAFAMSCCQNLWLFRSPGMEIHWLLPATVTVPAGLAALFNVSTFYHPELLKHTVALLIRTTHWALLTGWKYNNSQTWNILSTIIPLCGQLWTDYVVVPIWCQMEVSARSTAIGLCPTSNLPTGQMQHRASEWKMSCTSWTFSSADFLC